MPELLASIEFDAGRPIIAPAPVFTLGKVPVSTRGNLTTITGQAKTGKSSFGAAMIASTMAANASCDFLHVASSNATAEAVVHFDTEQDPARHHAMMRKVVARANLDSPPPWLHSYCFKGFSARDQRVLIEHALAKNQKLHGGIHSVFIDGIADLVSDPNQGDECISCVTWLERMAVNYNAAFVGVLHLNPTTSFGGAAKGRGHLGSQLERKAQTEIRLRRDRDGATSAWTPLARAQPLTVENAVRFKWDEAAGQHITTDSAQFTRDLSKLVKLHQEASEVPGLEAGLSHGQFVERWAATHRVSPKTAESRHSALKKFKLIAKQGNQWSLCAL